MAALCGGFGQLSFLKPYLAGVSAAEACFSNDLISRRAGAVWRYSNVAFDVMAGTGFCRWPATMCCGVPRIVGHSGGDTGFSSRLLLLPDEDIGVIA